jgi:hypothetical protein
MNSLIIKMGRKDMAKYIDSIPDDKVEGFTRAKGPIHKGIDYRLEMQAVSDDL